MAALSAQALLKQRALMFIGQTPVRSATLLAQELGSPRPSTSRALHALKRQGLVEQRDRIWHLTEAGEAEASRLNAQLAQKVERTGVSLTRLKQLIQASDSADVHDAAAKFSSFTDEMSEHLARQYDSLRTAMALPHGLTSSLANVARASAIPMGLDRSIVDITAQQRAALAGVESHTDRLWDAVRAQSSPTAPSRAYEALLAGVLDADPPSSIFHIHDQLAARVADVFGELAKPASLQELAVRGMGEITAPLALQNVVSDMMNTLAPPKDALYAAIAALSEPWTFTEQFAARSAVYDLFADVQAATARVQISNLTWLQGTLGAAPDNLIRGMLNETNLALGHLTADLDFLRNAPYTQWWGALVPDLIIVPGTYADYYATSLAQLARTYAHELVPPARIARTLVIPTATTTQLVGTARLIIEGEGGGSANGDEPATIAELDERAHLITGDRTLTVELTEQLYAIEERFGRQWEGAWHEMHTGGPNRHQLATHSARELLKQLLEHLAPDDLFTQDEIKQFGLKGEITRKMQIRRTLDLPLDDDSSTTKFIDAICSMYAILSGQAHLGTDKLRHNDTVISGLIMIAGGLIRVILGQREDSTWSGRLHRN